MFSKSEFGGNRRLVSLSFCRPPPQSSGILHHLVVLLGNQVPVYRTSHYRQVDDSIGLQSDQRVDSLEWNNEELDQGKIIKIKGLPKEHKVKLFRVEVSTHRTDYVVTNDFTQDSTEATHQTCGFRWRIEQLHREGKQLTGWEKCQCRKARIQCNAARTRRPPRGGWEALLPLGCALLVWVRLKYLAIANNSTVYQLKNGLLDRYLIQQLKNPSLKMTLA